MVQAIGRLKDGVSLDSGDGRGQHAQRRSEAPSAATAG
jgi:hypothetical protein